MHRVNDNGEFILNIMVTLTCFLSIHYNLTQTYELLSVYITDTRARTNVIIKNTSYQSEKIMLGLVCEFLLF